ncbi:MAG: diphthine--ammonia ligase [Erysipelotrichales bacterium]
MKFIMSFSGGKDSTLALDYMLRDNHQLVGLFTTTNKDEGSWFHDINLALLSKIADSLNTKLLAMPLSQQQYTEDFEQALQQLKEEYNIEAIAFGDIDIQKHFDWCKQRCDKVGIEAIFPLWNKNRLDIVKEFLDLEYKAIIKKVDKKVLNKDIIGSTLDYKMIDYFQEIGIDECGENGEYHTIVVDGPLFNNEIKVKVDSIEENEYTYNAKIYLEKE